GGLLRPRLRRPDPASAGQRSQRERHRRRRNSAQPGLETRRNRSYAPAPRGANHQPAISGRGQQIRRYSMRSTFAFIAAWLLTPALAPSADLTPAALRAAAQRGLVLLEKTSPTFLKKG